MIVVDDFSANWWTRNERRIGWQSAAPREFKEPNTVRSSVGSCDSFCICIHPGVKLVPATNEAWASQTVTEAFVRDQRTYPVFESSWTNTPSRGRVFPCSSRNAPTQNTGVRSIHSTGSGPFRVNTSMMPRPPFGSFARRRKHHLVPTKVLCFPSGSG